MTEKNKEKTNILILVLMASITFMAILAELMPSGVLPEIAEKLNVSQSQAGQLIGFYAIASALAGIPLVSLTININRKLLLTVLLSVFAFANLIVALAPSLTVALIGRALGGACAGTLWPMITAYAMKLVRKEEAGKAVTIVMAGITVGMSLGLPLLTLLGATYGYRSEFFALVFGLILIAVLCLLYLPSVPGEKASKMNSPFSMLKNIGVLRMLALTFFGVGAHYGVYTFITNLVKERAYPSVPTAQLFFGIGSVISVILLMRFIDKYMYGSMLAIFAIGVLTMFMLYIARNTVLLHFSFLLWGLGFGSLSSLFQTATAKQVKEGAAVANSLQSSSFNFAIMFGSSSAGLLLDVSGVNAILLAAVLLLFIGCIFSTFSKKSLDI